MHIRLAHQLFLRGIYYEGKLVNEMWYQDRHTTHTQSTYPIVLSYASDKLCSGGCHSLYFPTLIKNLLFPVKVHT